MKATSSVSFPLRSSDCNEPELLNVRFTTKLKWSAASHDVRFWPEADINDRLMGSQLRH